MSYQISNYSPRHHLFSSSLSHIFRGDSVTKGLWIFIWIAQINCLNLHVKRKMSIRERAEGIKHRLAFIKRYTWFGVMRTVFPPSFFLFFFLPFLDATFERGNWERPYANVEFKMLSQSNGLWLLFEYQWPCTEKVQGCSLTSLCLSSAASDPTKPGGIITARALPGNSLGNCKRFLCYKVNWPEGNRLKLFSFPFVCWLPQ